jgi:hypothetical protein
MLFYNRVVYVYHSDFICCLHGMAALKRQDVTEGKA